MVMDGSYFYLKLIKCIIKRRKILFQSILFCGQRAHLYLKSQQTKRLLSVSSDRFFYVSIFFLLNIQYIKEKIAGNIQKIEINISDI